MNQGSFPESVLIVDDKTAMRRLAATVLWTSGYRVREARDGIEAYALIQANQPFDLIITDVIMPTRWRIMEYWSQNCHF